MTTGAKAGFVYFGIVYAAGFALGTLRVLVVAPTLGEFAAVLVELPIMLALSWIACGFVLRRLAVPPAARATMAATSLVLLVLAEIGTGVVAFGQTLDAVLARMIAPGNWLGLAGQLFFAALPLLRQRGRVGG
ncbi:MAG: hypothetical protein ING44_03880 [Telmatospirillum sp.]|nr:hypothetical protein [Telmatospirillum sp.]